MRSKPSNVLIQPLTNDGLSISSSSPQPAQQSNTLQVFKSLISLQPTLTSQNEIILGEKDFLLFLLFILSRLLGTLTNLHVKSFAIFAASLRQTARSSATTILFIPKPASLAHQRIAENHQINLVEFEVSDFPTSFRSFHHTTYRWILYQQLLKNNSGFFLSSNPTLTKQILIIDVQDSYFQTNPFTHLTRSHAEKGLYLTTLSKTKTVESDVSLVGGIRNCFHNSKLILQRIESDAIISNSIIFGSAQEIFSYLTLYASIFLGQRIIHLPASNQLNYLQKNHRFPSCEKKNIDETLHNILISYYSHSIFTFPVFIENHLSFPIVHLKSVFNLFPHTQQHRQERDPTIFYRPHSATGEKYSIVHQYDELPGFGYLLLQKYFPDLIHGQDQLQSEWKSSNSPMSSSTSPTSLSVTSNACSSYSSILHYDLLSGQCDLISQPALNAATCCELCQRFSLNENNRVDDNYRKNSNCTSFVYHENQCYLKSCSMDKIDEHLRKFDEFTELMKKNPSKLFLTSSKNTNNKNTNHHNSQNHHHSQLMTSFHYQPHLLFAYAQRNHH